MEKLVCSLCGYEGNQKKFKYKDINEHFDKAIQVWCPRNCCKEQYDRTVPEGCICNYWYEYGGWHTIEEKPKIIDFEYAKSFHKAKMLRDYGMQMVKNKKI